MEPQQGPRNMNGLNEVQWKRGIPQHHTNRNEKKNNAKTRQNKEQEEKKREEHKI